MSRLRASLESWAAIRTLFSSFQDAGHVGRVGEIESNRTIVLQRDNTITLLFDKHNIMLILFPAIAARFLHNDKLRRSA
jgi:hypothetical protein